MKGHLPINLDNKNHSHFMNIFLEKSWTIIMFVTALLAVGFSTASFGIFIGVLLSNSGNMGSGIAGGFGLIWAFIFASIAVFCIESLNRSITKIYPSGAIKLIKRTRIVYIVVAFLCIIPATVLQFV